MDRAYRLPALAAAKPTRWGSPGPIVPRGFLPDLPEDFLQHLLGRGRVAQDAADEAQGGASEGVVEAAEGLPIARRDAGDEELRVIRRSGDWRIHDVNH